MIITSVGKSRCQECEFLFFYAVSTGFYAVSTGFYAVSFFRIFRNLAIRVAKVGSDCKPWHNIQTSRRWSHKVDCWMIVGYNELGHRIWQDHTMIPCFLSRLFFQLNGGTDHWWSGKVVMLTDNLAMIWSPIDKSTGNHLYQVHSWFFWEISWEDGHAFVPKWAKKLQMTKKTKSARARKKHDEVQKNINSWDSNNFAPLGVRRYIIALLGSFGAPHCPIDLSRVLNTWTCTGNGSERTEWK